MTDIYLRDKLTQYIKELRGYQLKLEEKKRRNPFIKDSITLIMDKVDLETSCLGDELQQIQNKEMSSARIKYKMTILDEINRVLQFQPSFVQTKQRNGCSKKPQKMKQFAEQLNSSWMLQILNQQKPNKTKVIQKPKTDSVAKTLKQQDQKFNKRNIAIQQLKLQAQGLKQIISRMKMNLSVHKHSKSLQQLQLLKQQQKQLINAVQDLKDSNLLLKSQFQKLQKQLNLLKKNRQILIENH